MKYIEKYLLVIARRSHLRIVLSVVVLLTIGVQFAFFRSADAVSTTPTTMNFQGRLTNSAGNIMADGLYNMKFRIYDAASAGTLKWSEVRETTNRVQVTNGLFSVQLGQVTPLDPTIFASGSLYFEIELPTPGTATCSTASCGTFTEGPMTPRNKLSTSAYAYNSETLDGLDSTDFIRNSTTIRSGNIAIQSAAAGNVGLQMRAATSQTADLAQFQDAAGSPMLVIDRFGRLAFGSTSAINGAGISLQTTDVNQQGMVVRGLNGQNVDIFDVQDYLGNNYFSVAGNGGTKVKVDSTAAFQVQSAGGTSALNVDTVANKVTMSDLVLSASKTLTLTGGNTAGRPVSPTEGMMYYDTTTKQLLTYSNGKWKAANKTNTVIVAASNSSQNAKDSAEYVADGTADEVEINAAIASLPATGGNVFLLAGTYNIAAPVTLNKTDAVLQGEGRSSQIKRSYNSATAAAFVSVTGTRATLRDLLIDGNKATYSNVNNIGILVDGANSAFLNNFVINNQSYGFDGVFGDSSLISGNDISGGGASAIRLYASNVLVTNNKIYSNSGYGVQSGDGGRLITVTGNNISSNTGGVRVAGTVSGNRIHSNTNEGVSVLASASVSGNLISSNGTGVSATCADAQKFTVTGNTILASTTIGVYLDCGGGTFGGSVSGNTIADSGNEGIKLNNSANGLTISGNTIQNSGGSGAFSSISLINGPVTNNYITGNLITDTAGTGYAINTNGTSGNYFSNNIYNGTGATSINDTGSNTYSNQLNASGQLINSASGGLATRLVSGSSNDLFQAQNASGTALMKVTSAGAIQSANFDTLAAGALTLGSTNATSIVLSQNSSVASGKTFQTQGDTSVKVTSANAFQVQNAGGTALLAVDTSGGTVTVGSVTNGVVLSANGVTYAGTARSTNTITLSPEYAGATFTGDGTNNTGTLTSDFCSGSAAGGININAAACGGATSTTRNYYQWANTQATAQDYDVYVRYQIPSNYSTGSMTNLKILGWGDTTASESVVIAMYVDGTTAACSTSGNAVTANATWSSSTIASPLGSCTVNAGDMVTFKISLIAGQNKSARASAISFGYRGAF